MYFFTADEHYGHANIIRYCNRPFKSSVEMDNELIRRHNSVVGAKDVVVHVGDFTMRSTRYALDVLSKLNGSHTFLPGSHDKWMNIRKMPAGTRYAPPVYELKIDGQVVVACHYAMRTWPKSHHGSWQVFGHSHAYLPPHGKQWDVGVDNNCFYPFSFDEIADIMNRGMK